MIAATQLKKLLKALQHIMLLCHEKNRVSERLQAWRHLCCVHTGMLGGGVLVGNSTNMHARIQCWCKCPNSGISGGRSCSSANARLSPNASCLPERRWRRVRVLGSTDDAAESTHFGRFGRAGFSSCVVVCERSRKPTVIISSGRPARGRRRARSACAQHASHIFSLRMILREDYPKS